MIRLGRILFIAGLLTIFLFSYCGAGQSRKQDPPSTLEFRLVESLHTDRLYGEHYASDLNILRKILDEEGTEGSRYRRNRIALERKMGLRGDEIFPLADDNTATHFPDKKFVVLKPTLLNCRDIKEVRKFWNRLTDKFEIRVFFNREGTIKLKRITALNMGKNLAIVWKGRILSAPRIRDYIPNGRAVITGFLSERAVTGVIRVINRCLAR